MVPFNSFDDSTAWYSTHANGPCSTLMRATPKLVSAKGPVYIPVTHGYASAALMVAEDPYLRLAANQDAISEAWDAAC